MTEKTFTMTLTKNEITAIALALGNTSSQIAFNQCGNLAKIIPVNCDTLDTIAKKFWDICE